jgi:hypothetical protein
VVLSFYRNQERLTHSHKFMQNFAGFGLGHNEFCVSVCCVLHCDCGFGDAPISTFLSYYPIDFSQHLPCVLLCHSLSHIQALATTCLSYSPHQPSRANFHFQQAEVPNDLCCLVNLSRPLTDTILALLKYYAFKGNWATVKSLQQRMVTSSWSEPRIANHKIDQILQSYCEFLKLCGLRFKLFHDGNQPFVYIVVVVECCLELRFTHFRAKLEWVQLLGACREKHKSKLSMCDDGCWVERYLKNFECEKLHST